MERHSFLSLLATSLIAASPPPISQSGQLLRSTADPNIVLQIADGFVPLPPVTLSLESTDVDRRIFIDASATHTIRRLIVLQFERVRHGGSFRFVYPAKPPFSFGGTTYRVGTYVYDDARDSAAAPNRESGVTRAALLRQGYVLPRLLRTARLARVANSAGTSEIIMFYEENADADYPAGPLTGADEDGDLVLRGVEARALLERMSAVISVSPASGSPHPG